MRYKAIEIRPGNGCIALFLECEDTLIVIGLKDLSLDCSSIREKYDKLFVLFEHNKKCDIRYGVQWYINLFNRIKKGVQ